MSPEESRGAELLLEPDTNPAADAYQNALCETGFPFTSFEVDDSGREFQRVSALGVKLTGEPFEMGIV